MLDLKVNDIKAEDVESALKKAAEKQLGNDVADQGAVDGAVHAACYAVSDFIISITSDRYSWHDRMVESLTVKANALEGAKATFSIDLILAEDAVEEDDRLENQPDESSVD